MSITYENAVDRAAVRVVRPERAPIVGRLFWVSKSGNRAKVILPAGNIISVHPDLLELIE